MSVTDPRQHAVFAPGERASRVGRMLAWLVAAIFILQVLGTAHHRHDQLRHVPDCVSCMFGAQPPSPPADPVLRVAMVGAAALHYELPAAVVRTGGRSRSIPIPRAQGPPATS
jgi:hypothetical protein